MIRISGKSNSQLRLENRYPIEIKFLVLKSKPNHNPFSACFSSFIFCYFPVHLHFLYHFTNHLLCSNCVPEPVLGAHSYSGENRQIICTCEPSVTVRRGDQSHHSQTCLCTLVLIFFLSGCPCTHQSSLIIFWSQFIPLFYLRG